jgi:hypothetical protein
MGDLRDREYRRFTVHEQSVRALLGALAAASHQSQPV